MSSYFFLQSDLSSKRFYMSLRHELLEEFTITPQRRRSWGGGGGRERQLAVAPPPPPWKYWGGKHNIIILNVVQ